MAVEIGRLFTRRNSRHHSLDGFTFSDPNAISPREISPNKKADHFKDFNQRLHTDNGAGRMLYNFGSNESLSESSDPINQVSHVLIENGGEAALPLLVEATGLDEEEIITLSHKMKGMIDVVQPQEETEPPLVTSEPLIAFMEEKGLMPETSTAQETVIFEASQENK